jgi:hypothetical protein
MTRTTLVKYSKMEEPSPLNAVTTAPAKVLCAERRIKPSGLKYQLVLSDFVDIMAGELTQAHVSRKRSPYWSSEPAIMSAFNQFR